MRGRPNNPAKAKAKARAHAKRAHFCSCGKRVFGNGGKAGHEDMHARKRDGERWISFEEWKTKFACYRDVDSAFCKGTCDGECQRFVERRRTEGERIVSSYLPDGVLIRME